MSGSFKLVRTLERRLLSYDKDPGYPEVAIISGISIGTSTYLLAVSRNSSAVGLDPFAFFASSQEKITDLPDDRDLGIVLSPNNTKDALIAQSKGDSKEITLEVIEDESFLSFVVQIHVTVSVSLGIPREIEEPTFQLKDSKFVLKKTEKGSVQEMYGHVVDKESQELDETPAPSDVKKKMKEKLKKQRITAKAPLLFHVSKDIKDLSLKDAHDFSAIVFAGLTEKSSLVWVRMTKTINQLLSLLSSHKEQVEILTFFPKNTICHPLTVVYPVSKTDEELVEIRRQIHLDNFLPLDRPLVRRLNSLTALLSTRHLINPHEGLDKPVGFPLSALVQGRYAYHHYMQDNFSDSGWGCAYRSLQTIVSWFRLQGYLDKDIPNHREIQQALVDCGDKPGNFVGGTKWIGSNEVSYVLNQLYRITSRMMYVSLGSEMVTKGRELVAHFETQGTPVMIGGGVLAHTIIGVAFDDKKGDTKFLILDPHYTGGEELSTVQKKGWCGWKPASFWDKNSFYNMCLPQRPQGI